MQLFKMINISGNFTDVEFENNEKRLQFLEIKTDADKQKFIELWSQEDYDLLAASLKVESVN